MGTKMISIRLDEGLLERVDGTGLKRSEFIRDAVEAALDGSVQKVHVATVPKKNSIAGSGSKLSGVAEVGVSSVPSGRAADQAVVLSLLRKKRLTSRQAEQAMGWAGLRYGNAEKALLSSGAVAVVDGALVVTE